MAATPKEIDAAVQKGTAHLKAQYRGVKPSLVAERGRGIGEAALAGLALLECGTPADDPAVQAITAGVHYSAFTETQTYHLALCLLFLDRLDDPADVPIIQMLAVRILAGQNNRGGWSYQCIDPVSERDDRTLRAALTVTELKAGNAPPRAAEKPNQKPEPARQGKLHPEVEKYVGRLAPSRRDRGDDNSNTQFGVLAVWTARKHGVPVERALDLIEKRFLNTQINGGWPYSGFAQGSPSMTCAGLLGLATAIGRREERRKGAPANQGDPFAKPPKEAPKDAPKKNDAKQNDDPFFNPPAAAKSNDPPHKAQAADAPTKKGEKMPTDARDAAVKRALTSLTGVLNRDAPQKGRRVQIRLGDRELGDRDFYFLWSLERVGVIYGLNKIGGIDWYDLGADELIPAQQDNGSWGAGKGTEADTAFALLFLSRSNLARDLSAKVQQGASNTELRAGAGPIKTDTDPDADHTPMPTTSVKPPATNPAPAVVAKPQPPAVPAASVDADAKTIAAELLATPDADWDKALAKARDAKGTGYTQGLVLTIRKLDGDRLKAAREALAERLTRMTAETLRTMATDTDAELRRGAVLAMAMKDDKTHLPDLVAALVDNEELVVRAAKAGLKGLTGEDFGPAPGAPLAERAAAAKVWLEWLRKQK